MYDSFTKMLNAAKTGDVTARREVAHTFLYENDMEELEPEITDLCLRYLNEAAESGDPDAMMDLGGMSMVPAGGTEDASACLSQDWAGFPLR